MTAMNRYSQLIREKITVDFRGMYREPGEKIPQPFITPGSQQYADVLWDWDSWLADMALRQILREVGDPAEAERARRYERGCVLNFAECTKGMGYIPILTQRTGWKMPDDVRAAMSFHRPCAARQFQRAHSSTLRRERHHSGCSSGRPRIHSMSAPLN